MSPPSGHPPPGWYPDPMQPGGSRWWDGAAWTAHLGPPMVYRSGPDVRGAIEAERSMRRWAKLAVWLVPATTLVSALVTVALFRDLFDDFDEELARIDEGGQFGSSSGLSSVTSLLSLLQLGCMVVLGLWVMRAGEVGRALGRRARLSPAWGIGGFFVPIVNFWFPYKVAVESLAPDADRGPVLRWWLTFVLSGLLVLAAIVVALVDGSMAFVVAVGGAVVVAGGWFGMRAVDHVAADHEAAVSGVG